MKKELGIIGFGNFGKFMTKHLSSHFNIFIFDTTKNIQDTNEEFKFVSLDEVCRKKIIILAVPMEGLESVLHKIKNKLMPGTLVLDVCSLKVFSCKLMDEILPNNIEIIGTHPLFGPQSAKNSIQGMRIALCNVRSDSFAKVNSFCEDLGLKTIITTPEEHDRQMAFSQAITHFIGQAAKKSSIERVELSTKTFDDLMNIIDIIGNDTRALFENMQTMNPYAKSIRDSFVKECIELNESIEKIKK